MPGFKRYFYRIGSWLPEPFKKGGKAREENMIRDFVSLKRDCKVLLTCQDRHLFPNPVKPQI
jgi:hypothetical protein